MKKQLLTLLVLFSVTFGFAQNLWRGASQQEAERSGKKERTSTPQTASYFHLDVENFKQALSSAPMRGEHSNLIIPFPNPDGTFENYKIWEAPVMHPELSAKHQNIKSYIGQSVENRSSVIRFSVTLFGLHAMTLAADNGTFYIDPYSNDGQYYMAYARFGLSSSRTFQCHVNESEPELRPSDMAAPQDNGAYRTYRTGIVTTVEFGDFHIAAAGLQGGTLAQKKACVLAAVVVTVTRVNSMFERDLSVFMQLIPNEEDVIFIDTDNLTDNDVGALIGETQETLDEIIGDENYDFGHGVGTSGGGLGGGTPCVTGQKAFGATGLGSPVGDPFDIDYVAHEMGHQFGAAHTFNNSCGGNRSDSWAYEPGSGSSIMAYAGICDPNIQSNSNAQFFAGSIIQIRNTINGTGGSCLTPTSNNNSRPTADAGIDYTIPRGTAFVLTGSATDADNDALTFMWEQYDNEISFQPPSANSTDGPNFKPQIITNVPVRYMPEMPSVLANNLTPTWEVISNVAREYNFAFTVRDNNINGGESRTDFMKVNVSGTAGPFVVTAPNTAVNWTAASNQTVTWNVAGTTGNGVNAAYVDILLSTNGGMNFNHVLAENVPNDGSETIVIPNLPGNANRIMVRGHGNIFFDVSNQNFTISAAGATFLFDVESVQTISICQGSDINFAFNYSQIGGFAGTTVFTLSGIPTNATATISPSPIVNDGIVQLDITNTQNSPAGVYPVTVTATSGSIVKTATVYINLLDNTFTNVGLNFPANMANGVGLTETLEWSDDPNATQYAVQVSTSPDFSSDVISGSSTTNSFTISGLAEATTYYWTVRPENAGCNGDFSAANQFMTGQIVCDDFASADVPVEIPGDIQVTVSSDLTITEPFDIQSASVSVDISHTYVGDLRLRLISPSGTQVTLATFRCGEFDDISATFTDGGSQLICDGTPVISGSLQPETPLSALIGEPSNGLWTLEVFDEFPWDGGFINSWSLNLCSVEPALATPENELTDFMVFPNPNSGSFSLRGQNSVEMFKVYDMRGRLIFEREASHSGEWTETINLNAEAGIYLLEASGGGQKTVKRFIVR